MDIKVILTNSLTSSNADTYIPLSKKIEFCDYAAPKCLEMLSLKASYADKTIQVPPMCKENTALRSRYLLGFLIKEYFHLPCETIEGDKWLMPQNEYDKYSEAHIFTVIERLKSVPELRDKIFDLMSDYKDLEKRLNTEIYSMLSAQNDVCLRLRLMLAELLSISPEEVKKAQEDMVNIKHELDDYMAQKSKSKENK